MRRIIATVATAAAAVTLAACGSGSTSTSSAPSASNSASATDHVQADVTFAQDMIAHHSQAIEMADLAPSRASSSEVRTLAAKIKAAQGPEIAEMTGWLKSWGQPTAASSSHTMAGGMQIPNDMPGMMSDADMSMLGSAKGTDFDRQFLTMMISHHEGAITMANTERSDGSYGPAKTLASAIITSQSAEIGEMKSMLKTV